MKPPPPTQPSEPERQAPDPARAPAMIGSRISHYRVLAQLGTGGMGNVYLAEDETLRRGVALKCLRAEFKLDRERRGRFLREARVLSQLDHPHICRIFNYVHEPDADYLVLEHIEGRDLRRVIAAGIEPKRAMELAQQITDALAAAHAAGIVHRDLKPANVMVTPEGNAKVLDFGLSHMRGSEADATPPASAPSDPAAVTPFVGEKGSLIWSFPVPALPETPSALRFDESLETLPGGLVGTLRYMSPEQARGEDATTASDVFALGLLLQELFTGEPAFEAELTPPQALERERRGETRPVRGVGKELGALIESLKSSTPSRRPTADTTLRRLRWIQRKPQRRLQRGAVAVALVAAVAGASKYTLDVSTERSRAEGRTEAALLMMQTLFSRQVPLLHEVGRLDAFDTVAEGVQAYFEGIADEELTATEELQLAKLFNLIGDARQMQGRMEDSRKAIAQALAITERLAARRPGDPQVLLTLGAAHFYLGRIALEVDADPKAALECFRAYLAAAERNAKVDPDRAQANREVAYARNAIAGAQLNLGHTREGLAEQEQVVALWRALHAEAPDDEAVSLDLADNLSWLASAHNDAGDRESAVRVFEEELELRRSLLSRDVRNAEAQARLSFCLTFLARLHFAAGRRDPAEPCASEAVRLLQDLVSRDSSNADWKASLAVAQSELAKASEQ